VTAQADRVPDQNLRCTDGIAQGQQCAVPGTHAEPALQGHDDREGRSLSPEGSGPKVFGGTVSNAHFPRRFRVPSNITKYDNLFII
jgi:hypothetical protein